MPLTKKIFQNKMRERSLSSHLSLRSSHKSAPKKGQTVQLHIENVEVQFYG